MSNIAAILMQNKGTCCKAQQMCIKPSFWEVCAPIKNHKQAISLSLAAFYGVFVVFLLDSELLGCGSAFILFKTGNCKENGAIDCRSTAGESIIAYFATTFLSLTHCDDVIASRELFECIYGS